MGAKRLEASTVLRVKNPIASTAVKAALSKIGSGWDLVGKTMREGLVARELIFLALGQADQTLTENPAFKEFVETCKSALEFIDSEDSGTK